MFTLNELIELSTEEQLEIQEHILSIYERKLKTSIETMPVLTSEIIDIICEIESCVRERNEIRLRIPPKYFDTLIENHIISESACLDYECSLLDLYFKGDYLISLYRKLDYYNGLSIKPAESEGDI